MNIIECDGCHNAFEASGLMAGRTVPCPVCRENIYIPLQPRVDVTFSRKSPSGSLSEEEKAQQEVASEPVTAAMNAARVDSKSPNQFALVGWIILALAIGLKFIPTPTTVVLSWLLTIGALAVGVYVARKSLKPGIALILSTVLIPTALSLWFWYQVSVVLKEETAKLTYRQLARDRELKIQTDNMMRSFQSAARPSTVSPSAQAAGRLPSPGTYGTVGTGPDWRAASKQAGLTGIVTKDGEKFAAVGGKLRRHGEQIQVSLGRHVYVFSVVIRDQNADLQPVSSRAP